MNVLFCENSREKSNQTALMVFFSMLDPLTVSFFYPFPNMPWFLRVCNTGFLKTRAGKGEIAPNELITRILSLYALFSKVLSEVSKLKHLF